uniref:Uncharacterized protein n=1 Tax=Steinernema glaseri TaxID=37863 RepID=A0A1I7Y422_9BILA
MSEDRDHDHLDEHKQRIVAVIPTCLNSPIKNAELRFLRTFRLTHNLQIESPIRVNDRLASLHYSDIYLV